MGCLHFLSQRRMGVLTPEKGFINVQMGKDRHPKEGFPAVFWWAWGGWGSVPSPWRMLDTKAWSQGPFAEVVWHPWPALEWLQNRGKDIEGYQKAANLKAAVWTQSVSSASISSASSSIPSSPLQMSLCPTILCALLYSVPHMSGHLWLCLLYIMHK